MSFTIGDMIEKELGKKPNYDYEKAHNRGHKEEFDADVADPNTDTTQDDFRQDLEITVTRVNIEALTKK